MILNADIDRMAVAIIAESEEFIKDKADAWVDAPVS